MTAGRERQFPDRPRPPRAKALYTVRSAARGGSDHARPQNGRGASAAPRRQHLPLLLRNLDAQRSKDTTARGVRCRRERTAASARPRRTGHAGLPGAARAPSRKGKHAAAVAENVLRRALAASTSRLFMFSCATPAAAHVAAHAAPRTPKQASHLRRGARKASCGRPAKRNAPSPPRSSRSQHHRHRHRRRRRRHRCCCYQRHRRQLLPPRCRTGRPS